MKLFIPYYIDRRASRRKENEYCLKENLANKEIDHIFILSEHDITFTHKKLTVLKLSHRPTFNDLLNISKLHEGIKIIANTDIFFTPKELNKLKDIDYANRVVALTRWNIVETGLPEFYSGSAVSQDTWVFEEVPNINIDYYLGIPGIDNRIAAEIEKAGIDIVNPSLSIKNYHYHLVGAGRRSEKIPSPYKFLKPSYFRKLPKVPTILHYSDDRLNLHGYNYTHVRDPQDLLKKADIVLLQKIIKPEIASKIKATIIGWNIEQLRQDGTFEKSEAMTTERRIYQLGQIYYPVTAARTSTPSTSPKNPTEKREIITDRVKECQADLLYTGEKHILSILIPTIESRSLKFMRLLNTLVKQINQNNLGKIVQVKYIKDRGKDEQIYYPIGKKRNDLLGMSDGNYVVYIDDDDEIHSEYVRLILEALESNPDCVTFNGKLTFKEGKTFAYNFSLDYKEYEQVNGVYKRPPGHLTPIRRDIAINYKFNEYSKLKDKGSDVQWAMNIVRSNALKSSVHIDKEMYHYLCNLNKKD